MLEFFLTTFLYTWIVDFTLSFYYGKMFYQPLMGDPIYPVKGWGARLFSAFCIIFLIACSYFWAPINTIILNNVIYSNIVSGLIGIILGLIIFYRSSKFDFKDYNKQLKKHEKRNNIILFIILGILLVLSLLLNRYL